MEYIFVSKILASDSSSESSENESDTEVLYAISKIKNREKHERTRYKFHTAVANFNDNEFKSHFRLSRTSVEELIVNCSRDKLVSRGRPPVPMTNCLLLTIWSLVNQESFREIGDRFGHSKGHAYILFIDTCKVLTSKVNMYIKWPTNGLNTVKEFNKLRGKNSFPDVFGCVDSTHIPIPTQLSDDLYRNKKGFHSVILQCICNAKMEFIDIYCGWPGSINDARVWENSPIYEKLSTECDNFLPKNTYLLGDFAYPLQKFIMVPFKENEHLSTKQRQFNAILSNTAALIEQSFGILKGIFRRLKYIYVTKLTNIKYIIISCCILHNIGLRNNDVEDFVIQDDDNDDLDESENVPTSDCEEAVELRNCIMNKIFT